jgi:hypothetical protein
MLSKGFARRAVTRYLTGAGLGMVSVTVTVPSIYVPPVDSTSTSLAHALVCALPNVFYFTNIQLIFLLLKSHFTPFLQCLPYFVPLVILHGAALMPG